MKKEDVAEFKEKLLKITIDELLNSEIKENLDEIGRIIAEIVIISIKKKKEKKRAYFRKQTNDGNINYRSEE